MTVRDSFLVTLKEPQDYDPALKQWSLETLPFVLERFGLKPLAEKGPASSWRSPACSAPPMS